jgi:hypothetical protein
MYKTKQLIMTFFGIGDQKKAYQLSLRVGPE